jgi:hypothetical protein
MTRLALLLSENKLEVSRSIWWRSGWTSWALRSNVWLLHVPLGFAPREQASCTHHASKVQRVIPRWCHVMSRGLRNRVPPWRARWHLWWWWYPSSEDDVHGLFHHALLHKFTNNSPGSFLPEEKRTKNIWKDKNCNEFSGIFIYKSETWIFLSCS